MDRATALRKLNNADWYLLRLLCRESDATEREALREARKTLKSVYNRVWAEKFFFV